MIGSEEMDRGTLLRTLAITGLVCILSVVALRYLPMPYLFIAGLYALVAGVAATRSVRPWIKACYFNAALLMVMMGAIELYFYELYFAEEPLREVEYRPMGEGVHQGGLIESFDYHEVLGYAYQRQPGFKETTRFKGTVLYDVSYALDEHGLRIAPPFQGGGDALPQCILFFGDSFTFGEGVKDDETLPYRTGVKMGSHYEAYNFGFLGYGPHQMLAQLQHGLVDEAIHCAPRYAIYQALPSHVSRAAGLEAWDQAGPKYILNKEGQIIALGHFNDVPQAGIHAAVRRFHQTLPYYVRNSLEKSALYRGILYMRRAIESRDVAVFAGIIEESRRFLGARYPGIEFHILFWDFSHQTDPTEVQIIEALKKTQIPLHLISSVLPNYLQHRDRYILHPADGHPNKLTYDLIADYIVGRIVKGDTGATGVDVVQDNMGRLH